jgi:pimeloyl-ACP methyl ester carboxylesterase
MTVPSVPAELRRGFFWAGVQRTQTPHGTFATDQMYVEWLAPHQASRPYPIVLVHGGGGQGTDWLGTPDGRPGWAPMLAEHGFEVYVVDRPGHGRSPAAPELVGPLTPPAPYEVLRDIFVNPAHAETHTQWPPGDDAMDQFMASGGPMPADFPAAHAREGRCLAALIDRVGPCVLVTHSAGAPGGWCATDLRPDPVAAVVAIEPLGPPFVRHPQLGLALSWGLTAAPVAYEPSVDDPIDLHDGLPRRLASIARVPVHLVTSPNSVVAESAPATAAFLRQHGCEVHELHLEEHGLAGNGHGMMMERNNREVLDVLVSHLHAHGLA